MLTNENPLDFLTTAPETEQWVVFHSKPRCEKKIQLLQRQKPAHIFLPCLKRVHNYGGRHREYDIPMFTGYVFGRILREDKQWYRQNPNVANIIEVIHEKTFLPPLRAIAEALQGGLDLEVYPNLQPGRKVLIIGGPMKGVEAEVIELKGRNKVVIHLELIQQSVAMEIDLAYIKPLV